MGCRSPASGLLFARGPSGQVASEHVVHHAAERGLQFGVRHLRERARPEQHAGDRALSSHHPDAPLSRHRGVPEQRLEVAFQLLIAMVYRAMLLQRVVAMQVRDRLPIAQVQLDQPPILQGKPDQQRHRDARARAEDLLGTFELTAAACRDLWGNPNPSATSTAWSMQHPVWTALAWSIGILVVSLPPTSTLYRRRTTN